MSDGRIKRDTQKTKNSLYRGRLARGKTGGRIWPVLLIALAVPAILPSEGLNCLGLTPAKIYATVYNMPRKALREQFPDAEIKRKAVYLSKADQSDLERRLGFRLSSRLHTFYVASRGGRVIGYGIFDTHRVRTKSETLFVVVEPSGAVRHVEVISFFEPSEYLAPERWLKLLRGKRDGFQPGVDVPAISGATMTTNAVTRTVRKVILLHGRHFGDRPNVASH